MEGGVRDGGYPGFVDYAYEGEDEEIDERCGEDRELHSGDAAEDIAEGGVGEEMSL